MQKNPAADNFEHIDSKSWKLSLNEITIYGIKLNILWPKEKLLMISNFRFGHNIFKMC